MDIQKYIDEYISWLKSEITFRQMDEYYEITTPFLDMDNDYLQLYVKQDGNKIYFSDDSYVLNMLAAHGVKLTPKRKSQLESTVMRFGVELKDNELVMLAPASAFAQKKHMFIQAMMKVCDLFFSSRIKTGNYVFTDEISSFLSSKEIYSTQNVQFQGKTGFPHTYDFLIQQTKHKPTRLCMAMNHATESNMNNILFSWTDTMDARHDGSQLIIFINDENKIQKGVEEGFRNYNAKPIPWSKIDRPEHIGLLIA